MIYDGIVFNINNFGHYFRYWRLKYKFTQLQLAERLYCTQQYISWVENCRSLPGLDYFFDFLSVFDLSVSEFLSADAAASVDI